MPRIPDFYDRTYDAETGTDELACRDCGFVTTYDHDELPPDGEMLVCPHCELPSRVPALQSQAGLADPIDPPPTNDRS